MRVVTELLAGVLGGLIVGWFLDRWLGTSPWLLITLLVLGVAAAFRNVWKLASRPPEDDGQA
jgi:ATP synthase protein I